MMREQNITLGEMRANNGPRRLVVYCSDFKCSHSVVVDAASWGDDVRLSDLEPKFICSACGRRGADVRPLFDLAYMGTG
jgi:hypothetical protein